jgi:hypothetical protein
VPVSEVNGMTLRRLAPLALILAVAGTAAAGER